VGLWALLIHLLGAPRSAAPSAHWAVYLSLIICVSVTTLLTSGRIVRIMEDRPDGPLRERGMPLAYGLDRLAHQVGLDQPALAVDRLLQRPLAPTRPPPGQPARLPAPLPPPPAAPAVPAAGQRSTGALGQPTPSAAGTQPPGGSPVPGPPALGPPPQAPPPDPSPTPGPTPTPEPLPTETPAPAHRPISPEAPLRVLVAGDSFAEPLGYDIARYGVTTRFLTSQLDFHLSSGLLSPFRTNWPLRLRQSLSANPPPEAVIFVLGANDYDNIRLEGGRALMMQTPAWQTEYERRAGELMDEAGARGARLYWVGLPILRDARRNATAADANAAVAAAASERPWVRFVDIWALFADAEGRYATFRPSATGEVTRVRQDDGIHLTRVATTWVAALVYEELQRDWGLP
jgi:hypothetical protein